MTKKVEEQLILVGFGSHNLDDMLNWRGTEKEEDLLFAPDKWPPRFRPERACSQKDIETFLKYVQWTSELLKKIQEKV